MNRIFLAIVIIVILVTRTFAQQMIPGQKGFELTYSVFPESPEKQNYALGAGLISYARNGNYFFGLAEYSRKYYEYKEYDVPLDTFLFNGGYSFYVWGDSMRNVNFNLSVSALIGYEHVNRGQSIVYDGSILNNTENFVYGAAAKLSLESYLTEHLVFIVNGQLRFLQNGKLGVLQFLFGCGLRYNF